VSIEAQQLNEKKKMWYFTPTAHTCPNTLQLPTESMVLPHPSEEDLFQLYDMAFKNTHFGIR
jgi:hypothetical protein